MRLAGWIVGALLSVLLFSTSCLAGQYDIAYYLGLVTASGGTTANSGSGRITDERGSEDDLTVANYQSSANAMLVHEHGGYVLISYWLYDDLSGWVLSTTRIFAVGSASIDFCGYYNHEQGFGMVPEKRLRFARTMDVGNSNSVSCTATLSSNSSKVPMAMGFFLQAANVTVPASALPSGSGDLTGCLRLICHEDTGMSGTMNVMVAGAGLGEVMYRSGQQYAPQDVSPMGSISAFASSKVTKWGSGSSFYGDFTSDAELNTIHGIIDGMSIPTAYTRGAGATVVIVPLS